MSRKRDSFFANLRGFCFDLDFLDLVAADSEAEKRARKVFKGTASVPC